jgi:hypothetical protein
MHLRVRLQEAHDVPAREESLKVAIRDYWQLVNIIPAHHLECLQCRSLWRYGVDLTDGPHHGLDAGLRPAIATYSFHFMRRDEADNLIVVDNDVAAKAVAQQELIDKVLQTQISLYRRAAAVHNFPDRSTAKLGHQSDLDVTRAGSVKQEPANECQPESAKVPALGEELKQTKKDDHECYSLADLR